MYIWSRSIRPCIKMKRGFKSEYRMKSGCVRCAYNTELIRSFRWYAVLFLLLHIVHLLWSLQRYRRLYRVIYYTLSRNVLMLMLHTHKYQIKFHTIYFGGLFMNFMHLSTKNVKSFFTFCTNWRTRQKKWILVSFKTFKSTEYICIMQYASLHSSHSFLAWFSRSLSLYLSLLTVCPSAFNASDTHLMPRRRNNDIYCIVCLCIRIWYGKSI